MRDTRQIKDRIVNFLGMRGPSLPVHISKDIKMDMIFTSAFLSELLSEKKIEMTKMSIGSSRIYYLQGQEEQLEQIGFENLKGKELEAFQKLKESKFLKNSTQEPAIKVALDSIPDFAKKIEFEGELIFRYFLEKSSYSKNPQTLQEKVEEAKEEIKQEPVKEETQEIKKEVEIKKNGKEEIEEEKNKEEIKREPLKKETQEIKEEKIVKKKTAKKKTSSSQKKNEKFFNSVKEHLNSKNIEIIDIETFSKNDLILRVKQENQENLLVCFNKKRIAETDIINAHKKASEIGLKYNILSLGEPTKKITSFIEAIKNLNYIEKIE